MTDLKPCPLCGGKAEYRKPFNDGRAGIKAGCPACGIWTRVHRSYACAAAAWNARAERTCKRVLYKPTGVLVCSECGAGMPKQLDKYCYLNYCPNCGAKVVD